MPLNLSNQLLGTSVVSIGKAMDAVISHGKSLGTGKKDNLDVVSMFIGNSLTDTSTVEDKILKNMNYAKQALKITENALNGIGNTLRSMLETVAQSTGSSDVNRQTLNDILQQKIAQVKQQTSSAQFDGRKLLTGDLGSEAALAAKYQNHSVNVKTIPASAAANAGFLAAGTAGVSTITINANTAVNEVVNLAGIEFTAVNNPSKEGQFKLGATIQETAQNLATAIKTHSAEALQAYNVTVAGAVITVTQNSASGRDINLTGSANMAAAVTTAGVTGGIDVSGIKNIDEFIGNMPTVNFTVVQQLTGATAKQTAIDNGNVTTGTAAANGGDSVGVFRAVVAGRTFQGSFFQANGGNLNSAELRMVETETGEYFTIKGDTGYTGVVTAGNTAAIATSLNTLWSGTTFQQTKTLKINNDGGEIVNKDGIVVGSVEGMTASFRTTNFKNLEFENFTVGVGLAAGDVKFTATINGEDYTKNVLAADIPLLIQGYKLDLAHAVNTTDILSINLGKGGLNKLNDVENFDAIELGLKNALMNVGKGLDVRIGASFDDTTTISISDISASKLYRNNDGNYVSKISVADEADAAIAHQAITNALKKIRSEQASIKSQGETIQNAADTLQASIQTTKEAASSYLDTDALESSTEFARNLKSIMASIAALNAGAKLPDAALQVINSAAQ